MPAIIGCCRAPDKGVSAFPLSKARRRWCARGGAAAARATSVDFQDVLRVGDRPQQPAHRFRGLAPEPAR